MIKIYTVLIQTRETLDTFAEYRSIFMDEIQSGSVGICQWVESGTTIDTALPDLHSLTDNKKEWRAVIIRTEADIAKSALPLDARNPYDFEAFSEMQENANGENQNDLIRLTQLLGGIPSPEKRFDPVVEERDGESGLIRNVVFKPVRNTEEEERVFRLQKQYEFDGIAPSSIILITVRLGHHFDDNDQAPYVRDENESSRFWKRNKYPGICRFVVFDYKKQGPFRREADRFRFWISVYLLIANELEPAFLQAYRLYNLNVQFDEQEMKHTFQSTINRLSSERLSLQHANQRERRRALQAETEIPDFRMEVPVTFTLPKLSRRKVRIRDFGMMSRSSSYEISRWAQSRREAEKTLEKSVKAADRALDKAADHFRSDYVFDEGAVETLDKYQREDMIEKTGALYEQLIELQGNLPTKKDLENEEMDKLDKKIRSLLKGRVQFKSAIYAMVVGLIFIAVAQIPGFITQQHHKVLALEMIALDALVLLAVLFICGFVVLLFQKWQIDGIMLNFNIKMQNYFRRLSSNVDDYSRYLTAVFSHSRGRTYIDAADRKQRSMSSIRKLRQKHMKAIDMFLARIERWNDVFHLGADFDRPASGKSSLLDVFIAPAENNMYQLDREPGNEAEINSSGMNAVTPYAFVSRLILDREEVFEKDNYYES